MQSTTLPDEIRARVRLEYGRIAEGEVPLGRASATEAHEIARRFGYSTAQLAGGVSPADLWSNLLLWGGLVLTGAVVVLISRAAAKRLQEC